MALMKTRRGALAATVAGNALYPLLSQGALTLSAGVITDDTRLAGVQGDGATYPASMAGVWPAATNLVPNGGFTTNTTGWAALNLSLTAGAGSIARSTAQSKFGGASLLVTPVSQYDSGGIQVALTTGTQYTLSMWVYPSATMNFGIAATDPTFADNFFVNGTTAGGTWTKVKLTFTTTKTASYFIRGLAFAASPPPFYIDGVHLETGSIATPYIETDGGTASRVAGTVTMPASVLDETQMWVAIRYRTGDVSTTAWSTPDPRLFWWGVNDSRISLYRHTANMLSIMSDNGTNYTCDVAMTYSLGDDVLAIGRVTSGGVSVAAKGGAFATPTARADIPTIAATSAGLGYKTDTGLGQMQGSIYWCAIGVGTLTDADSALFNSWGNNDPLPHMFPRSAQLTFLARFNGDGTFYRRSV